ncbi:ESX secretion-associated protein EspG [Nocardia sp. 2YAB30]|uniref:ESX secretion-associated protein EspG n=1 Tax=Nocardia sp. 2YAB30 TaxID=3233022 RepID=UPI003F98C8BD
MRRIWRFTDIEFVVLWQPLKEDFLPKPFVFTSRIPRYTDYLRELRETSERLGATMDPAFDDVLDVVARPDIRVVVRGVDGKNPQNPKGSIRLLAVRRGEQAYLLTQLPGETLGHSGGFTVAECDPLRLADAVVAELPAVAAGRQGEIVLVGGADAGDDTDYAYGRSQLWDPVEDMVHSRADRFLRSAVTSVGGIEISQGTSRFGPRGRVSRVLGWRDLDGDGRYAISADTPPVAVAADSKRLVTMINAQVVVIIRAIKDERQ